MTATTATGCGMVSLAMTLLTAGEGLLVICVVRDCGGMMEVVRLDSKVASGLAVTVTAMSKGFGCGSVFDTAAVVADNYTVAGIYWVSRRGFDIAMGYCCNYTESFFVDNDNFAFDHTEITTTQTNCCFMLDIVGVVRLTDSN